MKKKVKGVSHSPSSIVANSRFQRPTTMYYDLPHPSLNTNTYQTPLKFYQLSTKYYIVCLVLSQYYFVFTYEREGECPLPHTSFLRKKGNANIPFTFECLKLEGAILALKTEKVVCLPLVLAERGEQHHPLCWFDKMQSLCFNSLSIFLIRNFLILYLPQFRFMDVCMRSHLLSLPQSRLCLFAALHPKP